MPLKVLGQKPKIKNIIGIAAGKGGVGKSTLTVLLARALHELNYKVGVLDADLYGPSIRKMMPENQMPMQRGEQIIPANSEGISLISMAYFRNEDQASVVRAPIANGLIQQFLKQVDWGPLDVLLIDFPPGTGDIQITLSQHAHLTGALIVTTPQEVALMDVRKCIHMFQQVNIPLLGIVENMSYFKPAEAIEKVYPFGKGGGEKLSREYHAPLLGSIPLAPILNSQLDQGLSIFHNSETEELQKIFLHLAEKVMEQTKEEVSGFEIQSMTQIDPRTLLINWNDGNKSEYRLSELQAECPCAGCVDEATGLRRTVAHPIDREVSATNIQGVGRYAIKIQFNSGCSHGIYDFDMLRKMKGLPV